MTFQPRSLLEAAHQLETIEEALYSIDQSDGTAAAQRRALLDARCEWLNGTQALIAQELAEMDCY